MSDVESIAHRNSAESDINEDDLSNPSTFQLFETIKRNSNIFRSEVDGKARRYIVSGRDNCLYLIEDFVTWAIKEKSARPPVKKKSMILQSRYDLYYAYMKDFLSEYSISKVYSPKVELFFQISLVKYGLMPEDFLEGRDFYNCDLEMTNEEFFSKLISEIAEAASTAAFKRKLHARKEAANRGYMSSKKYIEALFDRYSRLLVLRIDFGFLTAVPELPHPIGLTEAQSHFSNFLNSKRCKSLYLHLKGYIWRLEFGRHKGYHWHIFFFFDGSKVCKDSYIADLIREDWSRITKSIGISYNCNRHKQKYKNLGIGMISHDEIDKRRNLLIPLAYMHKEDQVLREKHTGKTRGWGRGEMPKPHSSFGRPRCQDPPGYRRVS